MSAKKKNAGLAAVDRLAKAEDSLADVHNLLYRVLRNVKFDPSTDIMLKSEIEDFLGCIGWDKE